MLLMPARSSTHRAVQRDLTAPGAIIERMGSSPAPSRSLTGLREDMRSRMVRAHRGSVLIVAEDREVAFTFGTNAQEMMLATAAAERSGGPPPVACADPGEMVDRTVAFCEQRVDVAIVLRFTGLQASMPADDETGVLSTIMCGYRLTVDRAVRLPAETVRAAHLTDQRTGEQLPDEPGLIFA